MRGATCLRLLDGSSRCQAHLQHRDPPAHPLGAGGHLGGLLAASKLANEEAGSRRDLSKVDQLAVLGDAL